MIWRAVVSHCSWSAAPPAGSGLTNAIACGVAIGRKVVFTDATNISLGIPLLGSCVDFVRRRPPAASRLPSCRGAAAMRLEPPRVEPPTLDRKVPRPLPPVQLVPASLAGAGRPKPKLWPTGSRQRPLDGATRRAALYICYVYVGKFSLARDRRIV